MSEGGERFDRYVARAAALGHHGAVSPTPAGNGRWMVGCSCGYGGVTPKGGHPKVTRATELEAVRLIWTHIRGVVDAEDRRARVNGGRVVGHRVGAGL